MAQRYDDELRRVAALAKMTKADQKSPAAAPYMYGQTATILGAGQWQQILSVRVPRGMYTVRCGIIPADMNLSLASSFRSSGRFRVESAVGGGQPLIVDADIGRGSHVTVPAELITVYARTTLPSQDFRVSAHVVEGQTEGTQAFLTERQQLGPAADPATNFMSAPVPFMAESFNVMRELVANPIQVEIRDSNLVLDMFDATIPAAQPMNDWVPLPVDAAVVRVTNGAAAPTWARCVFRLRS